jgi:dipeptidyl aminopeptidase/acylaminoacyl peptidase
MKKISLFLLLAAIGVLVSCTKYKSPVSQNDKELDSLLALGKMTPELMWKFGRISELTLSPDGKTILYSVKHFNLKENKGKARLFTMPAEGGSPTLVATGSVNASNGVWRPDGKKIAYLSAEKGSTQIWEMNPDGTGRKQISNTDGDVIGFSFAPSGDGVLYVQEVKLDKNSLDLHPDLPKANVRIIGDMNYRHWDSWFEYTYQHLFVAKYEDGKISDAQDIMKDERFDCPNKPNGGMEQIAWSPDGKQIAYTCKKLAGLQYALSTNTDIYLYSLIDKSTKVLKNAVVEDAGNNLEGYDMDPVFSPDGKKIVWKSMQRPGFEADKERIIVYDLPTAKWEDFSIGFDQSSSNFNWSKDGSKIFFISGIKATYQVYSISLSDKSIKQITSGVHDYTSLFVNGDVIVGERMSMSSPVEVFRINPTDGKETQLTFVNKPIMDKIKMGKVEERWVNTTDGKQMLTWVIYPPDFDPAKKYPTLLYCQGGPQSAVSQFFSYRWNFQMMAASGYIIVAPNRRGLPTFGQEWNDQISQDYGGQNMKDYLSAIDAVSVEPFVNKDKLGCVGASYGGFSVFYLAGHHEKRFKAFISHCGMFNFESWYGYTEELWFPNFDLGGPYWQTPRPKSYDFSPHLFVDKWDTPMLIITGGKDFRIPYTESLQAFDIAQMRGIPSKLLFFPEETHFVSKPQNAVLWQREFFAWLDKYLK